MKLFSKRNKSVSNLSSILNYHVENIKKHQDKTYILVKFVKQDNQVIFYSLPLENNVVNINGVGYVVDEKCKYYFDYRLDKENYRVLLADIFEGVIVAYNPRIDPFTTDYNERLEKIVLSYLEEGILRANIKKRQAMTRIIIFIFLGIAATFAILKLLNLI